MSNKIERKDLFSKAGNMVKDHEEHKRLRMSSTSSINKLFELFESSDKGKTKAQVKSARGLYGDNVVTY